MSMIVTPDGMISFTKAHCNFQNDCLNKQQIDYDRSNIQGRMVYLYCSHCLKNGKNLIPTVKKGGNKLIYMFKNDPTMQDFHEPIHLPSS